MRSALIVVEADTTALASGADAILAETAPASPAGAPVYLIVRALDDPGALDDVRAAAQLRPAGVALRSVRGAADLQRLGGWLAVEEARQGLPDGSLRILAFAAETPESVLALPSLSGASTRLAGLIVTDAPALRGGPLRLARDLAVIAARAAGVPVLDASDHAGADALSEAIARARADGFDGMAVRSVAEVALVNAAFSP